MRDNIPGYNQTPSYGLEPPQNNLPNPHNSDRAVLERIEHKLDAVLALLVTHVVPGDKKTV